MGSELDMQAAAKLLMNAKKPVIIAGGGSVISGASEELLALGNFIQAPIITTQQGKGVIPEENNLSVGVNYALVGPARTVIPQCDVILAVGTRLLLPNIEIGSG